MEIKVKLVAINPNFSNPKMKAKIKKKYPYLNEIYYPAPMYSGVYIKRNNRYIGRAQGMMGIVKNHMSHTKFRAEISFTPAFDEFFTIQVDKNRNDLSKILIDLVQEKILNDKNLKGSTVAARIINAISGDPDSNIGGQALPYGECIIEEKKKSLLKKANKLKERLEKYYQPTENIGKIVSELESLNTVVSLERLEEHVAQIHSEFVINHERLYKDIDYLIDRVNEKRKRRVLFAGDFEDEKIYKIFRNLKEPNNEGELYGMFCLIQSLWPDIFDFKTIGYHTRDGVDLIVDISSELFEELQFNRRFGILIEKVKDTVGEENFTFSELKLNIPKNMNHSLQLVSHLICWQKPSFSEMNAIDGMYTFSDSNKKILVGETGNKVKVIYLKEVIEKNTGGKFKTAM